MGSLVARARPQPSSHLGATVDTDEDLAPNASDASDDGDDDDDGDDGDDDDDGDGASDAAQAVAPDWL